MKPLIHKKQITNIIGTDILVDVFDFPDGCYQQFEAACGNGIIATYYQKETRIYRNFDTLQSSTTETIRDIKYPGATSYIRQAAVRGYTDTQHSIFLGDDDIWMVLCLHVYIKRIGTDTAFTATAVPDNTITCAYTIDNPITDPAAPNSYHPFITSAILYESTWRGKHCTFYLTQQDVDNHNQRQMLLADADTDITIHGNIKVFGSQLYDNAGSARRIGIQNNDVLQYLDLYTLPADFALTLGSAPALNGISLHDDLTQDTAQTLADFISASTQYGYVYSTLSEYYEALVDAVDNSPYWNWGV